MMFPLNVRSFLKNIKLFKENNFFALNISKLLLTFIFNIISKPFIILEAFFYDKNIEKIKLQEDPIFIIGHWRTGTTFLHYLLCKDSQFGFLTNAYAFTFSCAYFLDNTFFRSLIRFFLPEKRPMDSLKLDIDLAQETEFAFMNISNMSCYHWWNFPDKMKKYFDNNLFLDQMSKINFLIFKKQYLNVIKKLSKLNKGKRLVLKNPIDTGRINFLLELFPNAKFVYCKRNRYETFYSTKKLHVKMISAFSFQKSYFENIDEDSFNKLILYFYKNILKQYEYQKNLIPKENLIELDFDELTNNTVSVLNRIYKKFNLKDFSNFLEKVCPYVNEMSKHKSDEYIVDDEIKVMIDEIVTDINLKIA